MNREFLDRALAIRGRNGEPLHQPHLYAGYASAARAYEDSLTDGGGPLPDPWEHMTTFAASHQACGTALFVRPRSAAHPESALERFGVAQLDPPGTAYGSQSDSILHLSSARLCWYLDQISRTSGEDEIALLQCLYGDIGKMYLALRPRFICFMSDVPPLERALAIVAKTLDIPTVTIQHGVFSAKLPLELLEGDVTDYFVAWGEYSKALILRGGNLTADQVIVSGYPLPFRSGDEQDALSNHKATLVFLGQNFENFNDELGEAKWRILELVRGNVQGLGLEFAYRPHPGESLDTLEKYVPRSEWLDRNEPLQELFSKFPAFAAIASTALWEAGMRGRVAIQVYDERFPCDDFGRIGACHSCMADEESIHDMFKSLAAGALTPMKVCSDLVEMPGDLTVTLGRIWSEIVDRTPILPVSAEFCNVHCTLRAQAGPEPDPYVIKGAAPLASTEETGRQIDAVAFLATAGDQAPIVPSFLPIGAIHSLASSLRTVSPGHYSLDDPVGPFVQSSVSLRVHVESRTVIVEDPSLTEGPLYWLIRLSGAFSADVAPTRIVFGPLASLPDRSEPIEVLADSAWLRLRIELPSDGRILTSAQVALAGGICRSTYEKAVVILDRRFAEQAKESAVNRRTAALNAKLSQVRAEVQGLRAEFDALKATRFWRVREAMAKIARSLRSKRSR